MTPDETADFIANSILGRKNDYYRIALSFCGNRDDALDAVSEMTLLVIERFVTLKDREAFAGWSTQILIRICRKYLRRRNRIVFLDDLETEIADAGSDNELSMDLRIALSVLKPIYREVIILKELLRYTFREIASALAIPIGTAQSRYTYGIKCMRKRLGGHYNEET